MTSPLHTYHLRSGVWQRFSTVGVNPAPHLWIGATVINGSGSSDISVWQQSNAIIGPLTCRRTYVPPKTVGQFPTDISQTDAGDDVVAGLRPFLSVKADPIGVAAGDFDGVIGQLAASFPVTGQCWLTYYHEPEDDMPASQFVPAFQRFYTVVKAANSNITVGPIHMSYQWRPGSTTTATPDDWYVGASFCDFLATDSYWDSSRGSTPLTLADDPYHQRWHTWAITKPKPLFVPERGISAVSDSQRAAMLLDEELWLKENGYVGVIYWDAYLDVIDAQPASANAWHQIATRGRTS